MCWAAHRARNPTWMCLIYDSGTSWDLPCLSECSWNLVSQCCQTSPLQYFHQKFPVGTNFPLSVFIALYEGEIRHKAPCQNVRFKSHHVPSVGKAALPAPLSCSNCCVEWNRIAQPLLASAGFCIMLFSPLLGRSSMCSLGVGNKWERLSRLSWDKWGDVKMFPRKHRQDIICKLYFHFLWRRARSVPGKRDAFISVQDFNWEKEPRKPKVIPHIMIRNLKCCPEKEWGKMQREKWYLSLN